MRKLLLQTVCALSVAAMLLILGRETARVYDARSELDNARHFEESIALLYKGEEKLNRLYGEADFALYQERDPAGLENIDREGNSFLLRIAEGDALFEAKLDLVGPSEGIRCKPVYFAGPMFLDIE